MLTAFQLRDQRLEQAPNEEALFPPEDAIWVDLVKPAAEVRAEVEQRYDVRLPDADDIAEIEATARFFKDEDGLHIHSLFLHDMEDPPVNVTVAFILKDERLFTLHDQELSTFRLFRLQARRQPGMIRSAMSILLALFTTKVDRLADILESVYTGLEAASRAVLGQAESEMEALLESIAKYEDITGKARLSLMDTQRALSFILRNAKLTPEQIERIQDVLRDIDSLLPHTAFLFDKVNFLMDAVQGFINIEQSQIIKTFSIAAVVFLPPTLIASIYGMNFHYMPELDWTFGYPLAIVLMIMSGFAPYWYFKRRGWL